MSAPSYQSEPQIQFLFQLIEEIGEGHLQLPRFQRPFLWTDEQRLELFRSIKSGTPIGSVMVWRTNVLDVRCYERLGSHVLKPPPSAPGSVRTYIIDGHQRLATLFGALHSPEKSAKDDSEEASYEIFYDLVEEEFFLEDAEPPATPRMPLRFALNFVELIRFERQLEKLPNGEALVKRADALAGAFKRYKLPILAIATNDLDQVTKTFQRINSQGTVMSEVHMVAALTWNPSFDLNERIALLKEEKLAPLGWGGLDDKQILHACKAALGLRIYEADVDAISQAIRERPEVIDGVMDDVVRAVQFLGDHCNIYMIAACQSISILRTFSTSSRSVPTGSIARSTIATAIHADTTVITSARRHVPRARSRSAHRCRYAAGRVAMRGRSRRAAPYRSPP